MSGLGFSLPTSRAFRINQHATRCACALRNVTIRNYRVQSGWAQQGPPLAFAFDIDGVLLKGENVIPQAKKAIQMLEGDNKLGIKIPYIFITNGGGVSEKTRCRKLSEKLGVEVSLSQFMQAHTVLRSVVNKYADEPVLVLGGRSGDVPRVAEEYGFRNVYTTLDILSWDQSIWPLHSLDENELAFLRPRPKFDPSTRFAAVFVFHDPRNWALDTQITCDILRNNGYVLPPSVLESTSRTLKGGQADPVGLVFCNPDLLWGNDYPTPRLGQGGFRVAFQSVYRELTGNEYPYTQLGKPTVETYEYAEELLRARLKELYQHYKNEGSQDEILPNVYMVGDNPESDIAGANTKGWSSILVKTGVYNPAFGPPSHEPTKIVDNVEQAVGWAIERVAS